ncbi:MAG: four helix bundle protein [Phycisphaerae bacterium]|nr:four helix bundle protein [Phycisphaerae bacterium]
MANGKATQRQQGVEALAERLLCFGVRVGKVVDALPDTRLGRHVAGQLVRCGTSPIPNYEEACGAESRRDFVHKMRVCLKELRESRAWLRFIVKAELLSERKLGELVEESDQLCRIFGQSVLTARQAAGRRLSSGVSNE